MAATADFNVIPLDVVIPSSATSATLTEGVDYTLPAGATASNTWVEISNSRLTGMGRTSGGGDQTLDNFTCSLNAPSPQTSITVERYGSTNDCRVAIQVFTYVGEGGGANEVIVREAGTVSATTGLQLTASVSGVAADSDVVPVITGQRLDHDSGDLWCSVLFSSTWNAGTLELDRLDSPTDTAATVSYAVLEFTGSNWSVQRMETSVEGNAWNNSNTGTATTLDIGDDLGGTDLVSLARSRSWSQYMTDNNVCGANDAGDVLELLSETQARLRNQSKGGTRTKVLWVAENSETDLDLEMKVERETFHLANGGSEEHIQNRTYADSIRDLSETSVGALSVSTTSGNSLRYPRGSTNALILSGTQVALKKSESASRERRYLEVVQWPRSDVGGGGGSSVTASASASATGSCTASGKVGRSVSASVVASTAVSCSLRRGRMASASSVSVSSASGTARRGRVGASSATGAGSVSGYARKRLRASASTVCASSVDTVARVGRGARSQVVALSTASASASLSRTVFASSTAPAHSSASAQVTVLSALSDAVLDAITVTKVVEIGAATAEIHSGTLSAGAVVARPIGRSPFPAKVLEQSPLILKSQSPQ